MYDIGKYFGKLPEALHDEFSELVGASFAVDALEQKIDQGGEAICGVGLWIDGFQDEHRIQ